MRKDKKQMFSWARLYWTIVFCAFISFSVYSIKGTLKAIDLAKYGKVANARVVERKKVGGKGTIKITYIFRVMDKVYDGSCTNENFKIGDSIQVKYFENDPSYNCEITNLNQFE